MSRTKSCTGVSSLAFAVWLGSAGDGMASGYAIKEQSASLLGTAMADRGKQALGVARRARVIGQIAHISTGTLTAASDFTPSALESS